MNESKLYSDNCFITLTYDDKHLPFQSNIDYSDFQRFMKRMRKMLKVPVRFFVCAEYGSDYGRPHFHACIFSYNFSDRVIDSRSEFGSVNYRSPLLEKLWPFGYSSVAELNQATAAYCARYIVKKQKDNDDEIYSDYDVVNVDTGELTKRNKELIRMSLKPGIGFAFYEKYCSDMFPNDLFVDAQGKVGLPPKFYLEKLKKSDPEMHERVINRRIERGIDNYKNTTKERLDAREKILESRNALLKRNLK